VAPRPISTDRLDLVPLQPAVARLLIARDRRGAELALALRLPEEFPSESDRTRFLTIQLDRMERFPDRRAWQVRLMVDRDRNVVGHCCFHGPPEVIGRAEIGYAVFAAYRGRGYAREAACALAQWAFRKGSREVCAAVSPANEPSLAVVRALGFEQIGIEEDGPELLFVVRPDTLVRAAPGG